MDAGTRRILVVAGLGTFGLLLVVGKLYQVHASMNFIKKKPAATLSTNEPCKLPVGPFPIAMANRWRSI
ncbi:MAG: hypothetical protein R3C26_10205 [Calditrichia bacterium]